MHTPSPTPPRAPLFSAKAKYYAHRAPVPVPVEEPVPGHVPGPGNEPIPHQDPEQVPEGEPQPAQLNV
jgi:hypothetical protein